MGGQLKRFVVALTVAAAATACSHTVDGAARQARPGVPDPDRSYGYVDERCGLLPVDAIEDLLGAQNLARPFSGAVCHYLLTTGEGLVDVVFTWFESGTLDRERNVATERGSRVQDIDVERHAAFLAQRQDNSNACSATAGAGTGVLAWWVQFRPPEADACTAAVKLLSATLSANL